MEAKKNKPLTVSSIMKDLGINQVEFSLLFGCRQPQVSHWISGMQPTAARAQQIVQRYHHLKVNPQLIALARENLQKMKRLYKSTQASMSK